MASTYRVVETGRAHDSGSRYRQLAHAEGFAAAINKRTGLAFQVQEKRGGRWHAVRDFPCRDNGCR